MRETQTTLPFSALVGLEAARQALLLLAVDPALGGVILAAGVGTGKSTLMRSFARLLAIGDDALVARPDHTAHAQFHTPFVELPVGITEDRLLGGLDLEGTLATGQRVHRSGLLARAHDGLLYADGINLLEDSTINHMLAALDCGIVRVERDGLSMTEAARFALLATYDPAEGPPRRHLLDRIGLIVAPMTQSPAADRAEVVRRNRTPSTAARHQEWIEEEHVLWALVMTAREILATVVIDDNQTEQLISAALAFGVEGHRADILLPARRWPRRRWPGATGSKTRISNEPFAMCFCRAQLACRSSRPSSRSNPRRSHPHQISQIIRQTSRTKRNRTSRRSRRKRSRLSKTWC